MKIAFGMIAASVLSTGIARAQEIHASDRADDARREDIVVTAARTNLPASALPLTVEIGRAHV